MPDPSNSIVGQARALFSNRYQCMAEVLMKPGWCAMCPEGTSTTTAGLHSQQVALHADHPAPIHLGLAPQQLLEALHALSPIHCNELSSSWKAAEPAPEGCY